MIMKGHIVKLSTKGRCEIDFPMPPSAYYDRTGHVSAWGIGKMIQDNAAITGKYEIVPTIKSEDIRFFLIQEKFVMTKNFHRMFSYGSKMAGYTYVTSVNDVTKRSICTNRLFCDTNTGEVYMKSQAKFVLVNYESRKTVACPEWFYNTVPLIDKHSEKLFVGNQESLNPPNSAFKTSVITRYSDLDWNYHINAAGYHNFCSDCASEASLSGYYRHCMSDIVKYPLLEIDCTYLGESGARETLCVFTWQDEKDMGLIYFAIFSKEKKIFQASYRFDLNVLKVQAMSNL